MTPGHALARAVERRSSASTRSRSRKRTLAELDDGSGISNRLPCIVHRVVLSRKSGWKSVRVAGKDIVTVQASRCQKKCVRNWEPGREPFKEMKDAVSPSLAAKCQEEAFHGLFGCLLGREARPLVSPAATACSACARSRWACANQSGPRFAMTSLPPSTEAYQQGNRKRGDRGWALVRQERWAAAAWERA